MHYSRAHSAVSLDLNDSEHSIHMLCSTSAMLGAMIKRGAQTSDPHRAPSLAFHLPSVLLCAYVICGNGLSPDQQAMWI